MASRPAPERPRPENWQVLLHDAIEGRRSAPFAWGSNDCCTLAADLVLALGGIDPIAAFRGRYSTEAEAQAIILAHGGLETLAADAAAAAGLPECPPSHAQRGDVALLELEGAAVLGVVLGVHVAVPGPDGLLFPRRGAIKRAWSV